MSSLPSSNVPVILILLPSTLLSEGSRLISSGNITTKSAINSRPSPKSGMPSTLMSNSAFTSSKIASESPEILRSDGILSALMNVAMNPSFMSILNSSSLTLAASIDGIDKVIPDFFESAPFSIEPNTVPPLNTMLPSISNSPLIADVPSSCLTGLMYNLSISSSIFLGIL